MEIKEKYPSCFERECFANKNGRCMALIDSNFGDKQCPFFKTKAMMEAIADDAMMQKRRAIKAMRAENQKSALKEIADGNDDTADFMKEAHSTLHDELERKGINDENSDWIS